MGIGHENWPRRDEPPGAGPDDKTNRLHPDESAFAHPDPEKTLRNIGAAGAEAPAHAVGEPLDDERHRFLRSIGIKETLMMSGELRPEAVFYPEGVPDDETLVEFCGEAERSMTAAIAKERPDRLEAETERDRIAQELMGEIEGVAHLGGTNAPMVMTFKGREMPAAYKARVKEVGVETGLEIRPGIPPGTFAAREWLAHQIDRAIGLDIVPVTVLRYGPDGLGSVQDWKPGRLGCNIMFVKAAKEYPAVAEQLERIALFDTAAQNCDRHDGNWIMQEDGKHFAHDNGFILPGGKPGFGNSLRSWPLWAVGGRQLSEGSKGLIESFQKSAAIKESLKRCFEAALGHQAEELWRKFNDNLNGMLKNGLPSETEWDKMTDVGDKFRQLNS
jgi:hypothetical protein